MQLLTFCLLVLMANRIECIPEKAVPAFVLFACLVDLVECCTRKNK